MNLGLTAGRARRAGAHDEAYSALDRHRNSPEAFTQLLRTGVPLGGRNLGMMGPWARDHLSHFTDAEVAALYRYLHSLR
jgi:hypothetical protein